MSCDWTEVVIKDVIEFNPKESLKKGQLTKKIAMDELQPFTRKISGYVTESFSGGAKFRNGDTLLARITPCLENGKTALVDILDQDEVSFGSTEFIVMRAKPGKTDSKFVYYLATSHDFRSLAIQSMTGTSGRQRVQNGLVENAVICIPPLDEQISIGGLLSSLDDKIELNNRINKTLEEMAQAIFKQWFVDFDFPDENGQPYKSSGGEMEESEFGLIPKGWRIGALEGLVEFNPARNLRKGEEVPYLDMQNVPVEGHYPHGWMDREFKGGSKFTNGDTLLARITPCLENSKTAHVDFLGDNQIGWGSTEFIVMRPKGNLPPSYAYFLCRSRDFRNYAIANMSGTSGRQRVPVDCLKRYLVSIPPESIFDKFGLIAEGALEMAKVNCEQNYKLANIRDSLLPKLMSGEIRVPVEEVPQSV